MNIQILYYSIRCKNTLAFIIYSATILEKLWLEWTSSFHRAIIIIIHFNKLSLEGKLQILLILPLFYYYNYEIHRVSRCLATPLFLIIIYVLILTFLLHHDYTHASPTCHMSHVQCKRCSIHSLAHLFLDLQRDSYKDS